MGRPCLNIGVTLAFWWCCSWHSRCLPVHFPLACVPACMPTGYCGLVKIHASITTVREIEYALESVRVMVETNIRKITWQTDWCVRYPHDCKRFFAHSESLTWSLSFISAHSTVLEKSSRVIYCNWCCFATDTSQYLQKVDLNWLSRLWAFCFDSSVSFIVLHHIRARETNDVRKTHWCYCSFRKFSPSSRSWGWCLSGCENSCHVCAG